MNKSSSYAEKNSDPSVWGTSVTPVYQLLKRIYALRGGNFDQESAYIIDADKNAIRLLEKPFGEHGFKGMEEAASLLHEALSNKWVITIVGDYDVDGATATAILKRALSPWTTVHAVIPDRKLEGYGLSPLLAKRIPEETRLVITVDNGIAAIEGAISVMDSGRKLLITDHHLAGDVLPVANAIIDPNQPNCPFPWKSTCGAGVAWYLLWALQIRFPEWKPKMPIRDLLALVAVATVADVVQLEGNNRHLVRIGLDIIRQERGPMGLQALMRVANRDPKQVTSMDCGFVIGPRINAVGRLENMMVGLNLLTSEDEKITKSLARELDTTNRERRKIESDSMKEAFEQAIQTINEKEFIKNPEANETHQIVVVADKEWHEGVVGLIAGRVREKLACPTFAFARAEHGGWKGSGRSIEGFHLRDAIAWVKAHNPDLIGNFGGHAMAAGLFLPDINKQDMDYAIETFRSTIQKYPGWIEWKNATHQIDETHDGILPPNLLELSTAIAIRAAGPWGAGFMEPVFEGVFKVVDTQEMNGGHWRLRLLPCDNEFPHNVHDGAPIVTAVRFLRDQQVVEPLPALDSRLKIRYTLQVNHWRETYSLQLMISNVTHLDSEKRK